MFWYLLPIVIEIILRLYLSLSWESGKGNFVLTKRIIFRQINFYAAGGEVLKLESINAHKKKAIKVVKSFIVNKLPHKDDMVLTMLTINCGGMVEYVLGLV